MTGDLNATGATAPGPLPPAFSQRPIPAPEPAAGDERPYPPFFPGAEGEAAPTFSAPTFAAQADFEMPAPVAPPPLEVAPPAPALTPAAPAAPVPESQSSIPRQVPTGGPKGSGGFGGLPSEAIFLPDAAIPRRPQPEAGPEEHAPAHPHDPRQRPVSTTDLAVMVAARLELFARRLRERGSDGLAESSSGDPLDLALAGLISGYIAGRRGS